MNRSFILKIALGYPVIKSLLISILVIFHFSIFSSSVNALSIEKNIEKSPNDQRNYLALTLDNKLQVLLVSDPNTDKASAAMDVYVGSADDPENFLGLAHFLEHMLFLGTKKYPTPDEYQKFISDHGGSHNAFTSLDHTNYFFDIHHGHLEEALDRFSQQFTAPLFNADYVEREVNAVHSEYTAKIKDDSRRFFEAVKTTLSPDHPYQKFSVGNLETLKDTPSKSLRDALLDFYDSHYSANNMKLVILGKEPLDTLKRWAIEKFSDIPNKDIDVVLVNQPFFDETSLPKQINVQTIMDKRTLSLAFPIPSDSEHTKSKPLNYIANLIGHEGKGSLLSKLKSMNLVDSLSAGSEFDTRVHALFMINMGLTEKGLSNYPLILETVFDYIALIQSQGIKKLYFEEQVILSEIAFKFQEKSEPIHFTSSLAMALQEKPVQTVLSEAYLLSDYDPELYKSYLSKLRPDNMLVSLSAKDVSTDSETRWYQTPYKTFKLSPELISSLEDTTQHEDLFLPHANEFIPESTDLLSDGKHDIPEHLKSSEGFDLWYAQDASFGTPKADIFLSLRSPLPNSSADNFNKTDILVSMLKDMLNEYSYPAYLAGLQFELYQHMRGITIKISGYNDKQGNLLIKILNTFKYGYFKEDRFDIEKERLKRQLENAKDKKPFEQALSIAQNSLIKPSWDEDARLTALKKLSFNEMPGFRDAFLSTLQSVLLINGNMTRASALNIGSQIEAVLLREAKKTSVERASIVKFSGSKPWLNYRSVEHPDTGFLYYIQGEEISLEEHARFLVLTQILSTEYYANIRTDKQLGYIVFMTNFTLLDVPGIAFVVQSPNASAETLLNETQEFLNAKIKMIQNIKADELERYKRSVSSRLLKQDNTLYSLSNKYWQDIDRENFDFNTNEKLAQTVMQLTLKDIESLIEAFVAKQHRHMMVYTAAQNQLSNENSQAFETFTEDVKASMEVFRSQN